MDASHPELRFVKASQEERLPSEQIASAIRSVPARLENVTSGAGHVHGPAPGPESAAVAGQTAARLQPMPVQEILISDDPGRSTVVLLEGVDGLPDAVFVNPHDATFLGTLTGSQWLPGITRALHGGWPFGKPGSWLLELGDGWAIFMIVSGLYLWWPRGRRLRDCLWPRFRLGARIALRDLHACVAVLFSVVFLFFLVSALPWTAFWGQELLPRLQTMLGQTGPFDFPIGGASATQLGLKLSALDNLVAEARRRNVKGTLDIKLAPWPDAPFNVANRYNAPTDDRVLVGNGQTGELIGDYSNADLPVIPWAVALGVHVHQGDFGPLNVWLNTAFAMSLLWLTATGLASWWIRRPKGQLGVPPRYKVAWRWPMTTTAIVLGLAMPIFGASVIAVACGERLVRFKIG
jgi:uncharacterized iron-regulated membrane protein